MVSAATGGWSREGKKEEREAGKQNDLLQSILEIQPVQVESTFKGHSSPPPRLVSLLHRGSAGCVVFVSQALEEPRSQPGPRPRGTVIHVCLERVGQLELRLHEAQRSLRAPGAAAGSSAMQQDSMEQQLLTCQVNSTHQVDSVNSEVKRGRMRPKSEYLWMSWLQVENSM